MRAAVDVMGGDHAPSAILKGCWDAAPLLDGGTFAQFYGIAIYLYYRDHAPPHFHAIYGEHEAEIEIATGNVVQGGLPRRAGVLVREWPRGARRSRVQLEQ